MSNLRRPLYGIVNARTVLALQISPPFDPKHERITLLATSPRDVAVQGLKEDAIALANNGSYPAGFLVIFSPIDVRIQVPAPGELWSRIVGMLFASPSKEQEQEREIPK
jgi:hypothetical protein